MLPSMGISDQPFDGWYFTFADFTKCGGTVAVPDTVTSTHWTEAGITYGGVVDVSVRPFVKNGRLDKYRNSDVDAFIANRTLIS
jgi:hypothetical protein